MKILGSDFDGTLAHGGIDEEKCNVISQWREAGHKFGIISGRGPLFFKRIPKMYPLLKTDFSAAYNGAVILDGEGRIIHNEVCSSVSVKALTSDLLSWGCTDVYVNGIDGECEPYLCVIAREKDAPSREAPENISLLEKMPNITTFNQISVAVSSVEVAASLTKRLKEAYGERINPLQNGVCIDIVPSGVNKAAGLYRVMEHFGASFEDVIAVGDNINDADMIREFRSYAMANGVDEIKRLANGIVESVSELIKREI